MSKVKLSREIIERRKRLNLVAYDDPNAKNNPANRMVYKV